MSLLVITAHADDKKAKCTTPPGECERIIRQMLSGRRYLGVQLQELNPGLSVKSVVEEGPADRAYLRPGDRFMAVNGKSTKEATIQDFKKILADAKETGRLWIIVQREGILKKIELRMEPYTKAQIDKIVAQHLAEAHSIVSAAPPQP
ncbi:MAG TPA: PDZ domain-containing protein [Thermoanaerobaculia bacterium]|nr:PDZ domain-containing protein [Thermoanaerobaculia bacterium]